MGDGKEGKMEENQRFERVSHWRNRLRDGEEKVKRAERESLDRGMEGFRGVELQRQEALREKDSFKV